MSSIVDKKCPLNITEMTSSSGDHSRDNVKSPTSLFLLNDLSSSNRSSTGTLPPNRRTRFTISNPTAEGGHQQGRYHHGPINRTTPMMGIAAARTSTMISALSLQHCRRTFSTEDLPHRVNSITNMSNNNMSPDFDDSGVYDQDSLISDDAGESQTDKSICSGTDDDECSFHSVCDSETMQEPPTKNDLSQDDKKSNVLLDPKDQTSSTIDDKDTKTKLQDSENPYKARKFLSRVELLEENIELKKQLDDKRKEVLKRKVASNFLFEALRREQRDRSELLESLQRKKEEVAARLILHNLLLNSWRVKNGELSCVSNENGQLHKTIDNLCLQLRVVRHLQTTEKEKSNARNKEYENLSSELEAIRTENRKIHIELQKVANERNSLQSKVEALQSDHNNISSKYQSLKSHKEGLIKSAEFNKIQAEKFQEENEQLLIEVEDSRQQLKTLTSQSNHWQEKARSFESDCWELKLHVETKDSKISKLQTEKNNLIKEKEVLELSRRKSYNKLELSHENLEKSINEKKEIQVSLKKYQLQLGQYENEISDLNSTLGRIKIENQELREKLYNYTLKNVRKRRVWGKALYFIFNPFEMLRSYYFGGNSSPDEIRHIQNTRFEHPHSQQRLNNNDMNPPKNNIQDG